MTPEEQRQKRDMLFDFGNITISEMLGRAASKLHEPLAYSSLRDPETGKRRALVIATFDPSTIAVIEKVFTLPE